MKNRNKRIIIAVGIVFLIISILASYILKSNEKLIERIATSNYKEPSDIQASELDKTLAQKIKPINYGDWAEYEVDLNDDNNLKNDWKIFYNDGTNVYLIAADYLDNEKIPQGAAMTTYGKYNAYWKESDGLASKTGAEDITQSIADQFLLKLYKEQYGTSTDVNAKATAILLDRSIWNDFAAGFEGSFAYGSPTIEMWTNSWNQKGYTQLIDGLYKQTATSQQDCRNLQQQETFETNGYGHREGKTQEDLKEISLNISSDTSGYGDTLYFPHNEKVDTTEKYFLASPTYRSYTNYKECTNTSRAECVTGDTDILTSIEGGTTTKAAELNEGDNIVYYDIDEQTTKLGKVNKKYTHENAKNFVEYTFEDGSNLKVTDYHPIYTEQGWKSFTQRKDYPVPQIGDKVKTPTGYKTLTGIREYTAQETCYDFSVKVDDSSEYPDNYFANNTLVQTSDVGALHTYTDFMMDCLVSCSYNGEIGRTMLGSDIGNAAIRPIVVLPTTAPGTLDADGIWLLKGQAKIITHHVEDETNRKLDEDVTETKLVGETYTTTTSEKVLNDKYEFVRKTDNWQGTIQNTEDIEVTYYYKLKKHKIKTNVEGTGGSITDEGKDICEEVEDGENSVKDIIIRPEEGYHIEEIIINGQPIEFTPNEDGSYIIEKFNSMTEDKNIVVKFAKNPDPTPSPTPTQSPTTTPTEEPTPTPVSTEEPTPTPEPPTSEPTEEPTPTQNPPTEKPKPTPFEDDPLPTLAPNEDDDALTLDDYYKKASMDKYDNENTYTNESGDTPSEGKTIYKNIPSNSPDTGDTIVLMGIIFGISFIATVVLITIKVKTKE